MGWIDDKLTPKEEVVFETRLHWSIFSLPSVLFAIATVDWWMSIPASVVLFYDLYKFFSKQFVVTNQRLIQKQGIYYIRTKDWPLEKIEDVIATKSIQDRLFGSGNVILMGISISKTKLIGVGYPDKLRNAIYSQLPTAKNYS
jgi:uncharacterized membrane protein YdbT with pleckstrin-like domain